MQSITKRDREIAKNQLANLSAEAAAAMAATLPNTDLSSEARALREKAAIKMAEAVAAGEQDHVLAPYLPLLEQNPRALKRLRNAYAIATMGRFASLDIPTSDADLDALIRWTILTLRWPHLACRLIEQPNPLRRHRDGDTSGLNAELANLLNDEDFERLSREPIAGVTPNLEQWIETEFDWTPSTRQPLVGDSALDPLADHQA